MISPPQRTPTDTLPEALALIGVVILAIWCLTPPGCAPSSATPPMTSRSVHIPVRGCTVVVLDQADGSESDVCLSAADLEPIVEARRKGGH